MFALWRAKRLNQPLLTGEAGGLGAIGGVELVEDGRDIVLDRAFGQGEPIADFAVAEPVADQTQDLALTFGKMFRFGLCRCVALAAELRNQACGDTRLDNTFTAMHPADCRQQFGRRRVFQQIPACARLHPFENIRIIIEGGQDDHPRLW